MVAVAVESAAIRRRGLADAENTRPLLQAGMIERICFSVDRLRFI